MSQNPSTGLSVRELLEQTFTNLVTQLGGRELKLPRPARPIIADDSDGHRKRTGQMEYTSVFLANCRNKSWVLGRGLAVGWYPKDPFDSDIIALSIEAAGLPEAQLAEVLRPAIEKGMFFQNSLIYGASDGLLKVSQHSRYCERMRKSLQGLELRRYFARLPNYHDSLMHPDGRALDIQTALYAPRFAPTLAQTLQSVLAVS